MSMSERTRVAIDELSRKYRGRVFSISELSRVCEVDVSTLTRYNAVEWEYEDINGQAFEVVTEILYRVL